MKTAEVLAWFGGQAATARALGIRQPSVCIWKTYPPALRQLQVERITKGELRAEPECDKFRVAKVS